MPTAHRRSRTRLRRPHLLLRPVVRVGLAVHLGLTVGCGAAEPFICIPCALLNDPRAAADTAVAHWQDQTGEADPCRIDAMQHCIAAALLAADCGPACAVGAGQVNESLQADADPADLHNNQQGSRCDAASADAAVACCEQRLGTGDLRTDGKCE